MGPGASISVLVLFVFLPYVVKGVVEVNEALLHSECPRLLTYAVLEGCNATSQPGTAIVKQATVRGWYLCWRNLGGDTELSSSWPRLRVLVPRVYASWIIPTLQQFEALYGVPLDFNVQEVSELMGTMLEDASLLPAQQHAVWLQTTASTQHLADLGLSVDLSRLVDLPSSGLRWSEVFQLFRLQLASYRGRTMSMPLDGTTLYMIFRGEILRRLGLQLPVTWRGLLDFVLAYGAARNAAIAAAGATAAAAAGGAADRTQAEAEAAASLPPYAICVPLGANCRHITLLQAIWSSISQTHGSQQGVHFDPATLQPLLDTPAAREAFRLLAAMLAAAAPPEPDEGCSHGSLAFARGRCALVVAGFVPQLRMLVLHDRFNATLRLSDVTVRPIPGSDVVWDRGGNGGRAGTGEVVVPCDLRRCPHASAAADVYGSGSGSGGSYDASLLINHAPLSPGSNLAGAVNSGMPSLIQYIGFEMLAYLASPDRYLPEQQPPSLQSIAPLREYLVSYERMDVWAAAGYDAELMNSSMPSIFFTRKHPNRAWDLRMPYYMKYNDVLAEIVRQLKNGSVILDEQLDPARAADPAAIILTAASSRSHRTVSPPTMSSSSSSPSPSSVATGSSSSAPTSGEIRLRQAGVAGNNGSLVSSAPPSSVSSPQLPLDPSLAPPSTSKRLSRALREGQGVLAAYYVPETYRQKYLDSLEIRNSEGLPHAHSSSRPPSGPKASGGMIAAVVVSGVVVLAGAAAGFLLWRRQWRRSSRGTNREWLRRHAEKARRRGGAGGEGAGDVNPAALVVTDIQDSTSLWEALPAGVMSEAVRLHHSCVRRLLVIHYGYESATEGDSFILAFRTVKQAVAFAMDLQAQLLVQPWPEELLEQQSCSVVSLELPDGLPFTSKPGHGDRSVRHGGGAGGGGGGHSALLSLSGRQQQWGSTAAAAAAAMMTTTGEDEGSRSRHDPSPLLLLIGSGRSPGGQSFLGTVGPGLGSALGSGSGLRGPGSGCGSPDGTGAGGGGDGDGSNYGDARRSGEEGGAAGPCAGSALRYLLFPAMLVLRAACGGRRALKFSLAGNQPPETTRGSPSLQRIVPESAAQQTGPWGNELPRQRRPALVSRQQDWSAKDLLQQPAEALHPQLQHHHHHHHHHLLLHHHHNHHQQRPAPQVPSPHRTFLPGHLASRPLEASCRAGLGRAAAGVAGAAAGAFVEPDADIAAHQAAVFATFAGGHSTADIDRMAGLTTGHSTYGMPEEAFLAEGGDSEYGRFLPATTAVAAAAAATAAAPAAFEFGARCGVTGAIGTVTVVSPFAADTHWHPAATLDDCVESLPRRRRLSLALAEKVDVGGSGGSRGGGEGDHMCSCPTSEINEEQSEEEVQWSGGVAAAARDAALRPMCRTHTELRRLVTAADVANSPLLGRGLAPSDPVVRSNSWGPASLWALQVAVGWPAEGLSSSRETADAGTVDRPAPDLPAAARLSVPSPHLPPSPRRASPGGSAKGHHRGPAPAAMVLALDQQDLDLDPLDGMLRGADGNVGGRPQEGAAEIEEVKEGEQAAASDAVEADDDQQAQAEAEEAEEPTARLCRLQTGCTGTSASCGRGSSGPHSGGVLVSGGTISSSRNSGVTVSGDACPHRRQSPRLTQPPAAGGGPAVVHRGTREEGPRMPCQQPPPIALCSSSQHPAPWLPAQSPSSAHSTSAGTTGSSATAVVPPTSPGVKHASSQANGHSASFSFHMFGIGAAAMLAPDEGPPPAVAAAAQPGDDGFGALSGGAAAKPTPSSYESLADMKTPSATDATAREQVRPDLTAITAAGLPAASILQLATPGVHTRAEKPFLRTGEPAEGPTSGHQSSALLNPVPSLCALSSPHRQQREPLRPSSFCDSGATRLQHSQGASRFPGSLPQRAKDPRAEAVPVWGRAFWTEPGHVKAPPSAPQSQCGLVSFAAEGSPAAALGARVAAGSKAASAKAATAGAAAGAAAAANAGDAAITLSQSLSNRGRFRQRRPASSARVMLTWYGDAEGGTAGKAPSSAVGPSSLRFGGGSVGGDSAGSGGTTSAGFRAHSGRTTLQRLAGLTGLAGLNNSRHGPRPAAVAGAAVGAEQEEGWAGAWSPFPNSAAPSVAGSLRPAEAEASPAPRLTLGQALQGLREATTTAAPAAAKSHRRLLSAAAAAGGSRSRRTTLELDRATALAGGLGGAGASSAVVASGGVGGGRSAPVVFRGLRVRVGITWCLPGPSELQYNTAAARMVYGGPCVTACKAVADMAHGGQVVMSGEAAAQLAAECGPGNGGRPSGTVMLHLGTFGFVRASSGEQRATSSPSHHLSTIVSRFPTSVGGSPAHEALQKRHAPLTLVPTDPMSMMKLSLSPPPFVGIAAPTAVAAGPAGCTTGSPDVYGLSSPLSQRLSGVHASSQITGGSDASLLQLLTGRPSISCTATTAAAVVASVPSPPPQQPAVEERSVFWVTTPPLVPRLALVPPLRVPPEAVRFYDVYDAPMGRVSYVVVQIPAAGALLAWNDQVAEQALQLFEAAAGVQMQRVAPCGVGFKVTSACDLHRGQYCAAFTTAAAAVRWAEGLRLDLLEAPWPPELLRHELCEVVAAVVSPTGPRGVLPLANSRRTVAPQRSQRLRRRSLNFFAPTEPRPATCPVTVAAATTAAETEAAATAATASEAAAAAESSSSTPTPAVSLPQGRPFRPPSACSGRRNPTNVRNVSGIQLAALLMLRRQECGSKIRRQTMTSASASARGACGPQGGGGGPESYPGSHGGDPRVTATTSRPGSDSLTDAGGGGGGSSADSYPRGVQPWIGRETSAASTLSVRPFSDSVSQSPAATRPEQSQQQSQQLHLLLASGSAAGGGCESRKVKDPGRVRTVPPRSADSSAHGGPMTSSEGPIAVAAAAAAQRAANNGQGSEDGPTGLGPTSQMLTPFRATAKTPRSGTAPGVPLRSAGQHAGQAGLFDASRFPDRDPAGSGATDAPAGRPSVRTTSSLDLTSSHVSNGCNHHNHRHVRLSHHLHGSHHTQHASQAGALSNGHPGLMAHALSNKDFHGRKQTHGSAQAHLVQDGSTEHPQHRQQQQQQTPETHPPERQPPQPCTAEVTPAGPEELTAAPLEPAVGREAMDVPSMAWRPRPVLLLRGLRIRAGISSGHAEWSIADASHALSYHGRPVHTATKLAAAACSGQVLCDNATRQEAMADQMWALSMLEEWTGEGGAAAAATEGGEQKQGQQSTNGGQQGGPSTRVSVVGSVANGQSCYTAVELRRADEQLFLTGANPLGPGDKDAVGAAAAGAASGVGADAAATAAAKQPKCRPMGMQTGAGGGRSQLLVFTPALEAAGYNAAKQKVLGQAFLCGMYDNRSESSQPPPVPPQEGDLPPAGKEPAGDGSGRLSSALLLPVAHFTATLPRLEAPPFACASATHRTASVDGTLLPPRARTPLGASPHGHLDTSARRPHPCVGFAVGSLPLTPRPASAVATSVSFGRALGADQAAAPALEVIPPDGRAPRGWAPAGGAAANAAAAIARTPSTNPLRLRWRDSSGGGSSAVSGVQGGRVLSVGAQTQAAAGE